MTLKVKPVKSPKFDSKPATPNSPGRPRLERIARADVALTPVMEKLRPLLHQQLYKAIDALPGYGGVSSHLSSWIRCHVSWNYIDADLYVEPKPHAFQEEEPENRTCDHDNDLIFGRYVVNHGVQIISRINLPAANRTSADILPWIEDVRTMANILRWAERYTDDFLIRAHAEIGMVYREK